MIVNDVEKYVFMPDEYLTMIKRVKEDLFRFASLLIFNLRQYCQMWVKDSWEVINQLRRRSIISDEIWMSLRIIYSIGIYARLAAYHKINSQTEYFSVLPVAPESKLYQFPKSLLMHLLIHLIPLWEAFGVYFKSDDHSPLKKRLLIGHLLLLW